MADPAQVLGVTGSSVDATTHSVVLPSTLTTGHLIVIYLGLRLNRTVTIPGDWTRVHADAIESDSNDCELVTIQKIAEESDKGATVVITTNAATRVGWVIATYANATTIYSATPRTNQGLTGAPDPPALTIPGAAAMTLWTNVVSIRDGATTNEPGGYTGKLVGQGGSTGNAGALAYCRATAGAVSQSTTNPNPWAIGTNRRCVSNTYGIRNEAVVVTLPFIASGAQMFTPSVSRRIELPRIESGAQLFTPRLTYDQVVSMPFLASGAQFYPFNLVTAEVGLPFIESGAQMFAPTVEVGAAVVSLPFIASGARVYPILVTGGARVIPQFTKVAIGTDAGAISDLAFYSNFNEGAAFANRWAFRGPIGFGDFSAFVAGEYEFEDAVIWMRLNVEPVERVFAITRAKMNIDVPDVIDRGEAELPPGGAWINFSRVFFAPPDVVAQVVTAVGVTAAPKVTVRDDIETGRFFAVCHTGDDTTDTVAARIKWVAAGY